MGTAKWIAGLLGWVALGPDVQKAAEEKFRKIQEAYETIKKQRGIK